MAKQPKAQKAASDQPDVEGRELTASPSGPIATATVTELSAALHGVIAKGLPTSEEAAGLLLNLRSVYARAVIPREPRSRLAALNELLPRLIATLADPIFRDAVQFLFGLAPGTRGAGLMNRRRQAADALGFSLSHFREEKEPDLLDAVAIAAHDDLLRYQSRVKRTVESLEPTGDTPRLGPEHINHEEELISRIWQHVYGLRAEAIAVARLDDQAGYESQTEDHRQAARREEEALKALLSEYVATYGTELIRHGDAEYRVSNLNTIALWQR